MIMLACCCRHLWLRPSVPVGYKLVVVLFALGMSIPSQCTMLLNGSAQVAPTTACLQTCHKMWMLLFAHPENSSTRTNRHQIV